MATVRRGYGVRRLFNLLRNELGVSRAAAEQLGGGALRALHPGEARRRRAAARSAPAGPLEIPRELGWAPVPTKRLPALGPAAEACRTLFQEHAAQNPHDKPFFAVVAGGEPLMRLPELRALVLHEDLVAAVSRYLGEVPVLGTADLMLTPPNSTLERSQLFHFDFAGPQVKLFVSVLETAPEHGPFTFLPAPASGEAAACERYWRGRLEDAAVFRHAPESQLQRLMGPPGSAVLVDTSRCLHYGSRHNRAPRLMLIVQYISLLAPGLGPAEWRLADPALLERLGPRERMLFRTG